MRRTLSKISQGKCTKKYGNKSKKLYFAFADSEKAFDSGRISST